MLYAFGDKVLTKNVLEETKTRSGILISPDDDSRKDAVVAEIVSIGKDVKDLKVGQRVVFASYSGTKCVVNNEEYTVVTFSDILAILE